MKPFPVANLAGRGPHRIGAVFLEPFVGIQEKVLLGPQHSTQRLPHHIGGVLAYAGGRYHPIELVGLASAGLHDLVKFLAERVPRYWVAEP
jgi:hypothetical protein